MTGIGLEACAAEMQRRADPTPAVSAAVRRKRRARAIELDEVWAVVERGEFFAFGFRSATDWLVTTTGEGVGVCKSTIVLAERIQQMPVVRSAFADGAVSESNLRLLADAWHETIAEVFAGHEEMLCSWATRLPHRDFKIVLDTWRMHAD